MSYLELLKLASPEAVIVVTALIVLSIGLLAKRPRSACGFVAGLGLIISIGAILLLPSNRTVFGGMLAISPLTSLFKIICLALAFFTILLTQAEKGPRHPGEYLALVLLATVGLMLLVGSEELLMIFIGLELLGLSLYVMAAFDKTDARSAEAGLKYFLFGSTSSAFTLFGISLIYGITGTTGLSQIAAKLATVSMQPLLAVGIIMTLVGFAFKIAAAPFHLWAPDAYQGAPVPSAAFIASGSKVASFVVLGKIVLIGFAPVHGSAGWHAMSPGWSPLLATLAASSIVVGNLVALAQSNVRRLLAYSAVAHAGYTLIGIVAGDREGFSAALFYTTVYAVTLVGAFGVVGVVRRETGGDNFSNFSGLVSRSPLLAGCMLTQAAGWGIVPDYFAVVRPESYRWLVPALNNPTEMSQLSMTLGAVLLLAIAVCELVPAIRQRAGLPVRAGIYFCAATIYYLSVSGVACVDMISGWTFIPLACTSAAASKIARACISEISGNVIPSLHPR